MYVNSEQIIGLNVKSKSIKIIIIKEKILFVFELLNNKTPKRMIHKEKLINGT